MSGNVLNPLAAWQSAQMQAAAKPIRSGRMVSYNPSKAVAVAKKKESTSDREAYLDSLFANAESVKQKKQSGGDGGIMGAVLNNPVGKAVSEALGTLDVPRRVVISGLKEIADGVSGGSMSFKDFNSQINDPTFGVGRFVHTGNKWLDRGLGFVGDVALDPLTYVTFGANKFAGGAGRIAAAEKVAAAGLDASKVARLGVLGANAAEREAIFAGMKGAEELAQPGLRFAGRRIKGTGGLADRVGGGLTKTRAAIGDTRVGQAIRDVRAVEETAGAARTLARGEVGTNDALAQFARARTHAGSSGMFSKQFENGASKLAHVAHKAGDAADREAYRILDEGLAHGGNQLAADGGRFFEDVYVKASDLLPEMGKRTDFAPHVYTAESRKALRGDVWADVRKSVGMDVTEATGGAVRRQVHPGGRLTLPDGSIIEWVADTAHGGVSARQINAKLGPALGVKTVVEDRLSRVLQPYVEGMADSVGRAGGLRELGRIADNGAMVNVVDQAATDVAARKMTASLGNKTRKVAGKNAYVVKNLDLAAGQVKKDVVSQLERQVADTQLLAPIAVGAEAKAKAGAKALAVDRKAVTAEAVGAVSAAQKRLEQIAGDQRVLHEAAVAERASIDEQKLLGKRAHDAELKRAKRAAGNAPGDDAAAERVVAASGPIPETSAAVEASKALDTHVARQQASIDARRDSALGSMSQAESKAAKAYDEIDAAKAVAGRARFDAVGAKASAKMDVGQAQARLKKVMAVKVSPSKATTAGYRQVQHDLDEAVKLAGAGSEDVKALVAYYATGVSELSDGLEMNKYLASMQKAVVSGEIAPVMKKMVQDGYEQIGVGLLGEEAPIVRKELARQLQQLNVAFNDPGFFKVIDKYTQFFKTYATATLGFHVRNGMSAAFMNATDGVSVVNMGRGAKLWEQLERDPQGWLDRLPSWVSKDQAESAMRAVYSSGGGSGQFGKAEIRLGKSKLINNPYTRASQRLGGRVEGFARMGMALDTVLAGGTWQEAAARITRIHFDYSQVSKLDRVAKRIIPFWTFMSRNLPLQVQQMFMRPRMYQAYAALQRNMGQDYEGGMIPKSWAEAGAFKITDGVWAAPDLPHIRMISEIGKLTSDPQRLLADANPLFKVPFETLIGKRKLYSDSPFKPNGFESVDGAGLQLLAPLLSALGVSDTAGDGSQVVDERLAYALRGLIPPLAQVQRLFGNDPYYKDKRGQSVSNFNGLPLRLLTDGQKRAEKDRRARASTTRSSSDARKQALADWKP